MISGYAHGNAPKPSFTKFAIHDIIQSNQTAMDPRLIVFEVGYIVGIVLTVGLGFFVWWKARRNALSTIFLLMNLSIAVVEFSVVVIAVSTNERLVALSYLFNMANIFIVVFMAHWVLELIGKTRKEIVPLFLTYFFGLLLFIYFLFEPRAFLLTPVPKLYLRHYFVPGLWYTVMRGYFTAVTVYFLYQLFAAYRTAADNVMRNRIKYVFAGILFGMLTGHIALFLVYNVPVDPLLSMLFPLYTIPFAYAIIHYELMDIRIVAKRAFFYTLTVSLFAVLIGLVSASNGLIAERLPWLPYWALPIIVSLVASALGFSVWFRLKESETLKYEFITIVTHKFRTPLTQIKWTIERLLANPAAPDAAEGLKVIARANTSLTDLTNIIIKATESENNDHPYVFQAVSLPEVVQEILKSFQKEAARKRIGLTLSVDKNLPMVRADKAHLTIVLQTLLENALMYTQEGGTVAMAVRLKNRFVECGIADSGIGISREDMPRVFTKLYRSEAAKRIMTEGMGIGLFIAKQIIDRHGGRIAASSPGPGKGATFSVSIPAAVP